jgi:hypothetical protein
MKTQAGNLWAGLLASTCFAIGASAAVLHVDLNNVNPVLPYADWATAAADIQSAIDASSDGDLILVTNGVYQTGGRVVYGSLTNRVVIDKAVTVQSVNGPQTTIIQGYQVPGILNDDSAIRCVYLTNNATLIGFTLTGGATRNLYDFNTNIKERSGGGAWCESSSSTISNCIVTRNSCYWYGAGVYSGTVISSQISNNTNNNGSLGGGGGAAFSTLLNSTISSNYLRNPGGGGAFSCILSNCAIVGNAMGGALNCVLTDCTLENNTNNSTGGGASQSVLNHCRVYNNSAQDGGGVYQCELNFCTISNNLASHWGGGVYEIANATNRAGANNYVVGNSAGFLGGGAYFTSLGQFASTNWDFSGWTFSSNSATRDGGGFYNSGSYQPPTVKYCAFNGNHAGGNGGGLCNSSASTLIIASNCIFTGNSAIGNGGGAYAGSLINCTVVGNQGGNGGGVYGTITNCVLNDNIAATNGGGVFLVLISGPIIIFGNNCFTNNLAGGNGGGAYSLVGNNGGPGVTFSNCVFFGNTAITNGGGIYQAALKNSLVISNQAASGGGGFGVFFQNCTISNNQAILGGGGCGGRFSDCSIAGNFATDSGGGICYNPLNSSPTFATNCIFTDNHANTNGGGAYCSFSVNISRCRFLGNSAGANGGGTYGMNLINCLLVGNSAANGGGSYAASPNNSTIVGNTATITGGGVYFPSNGSIAGCIIYDNNAPVGVNYFGVSSATACCTTPLPPGLINITNAPVFVSSAGGNFRLQTNSPCINVGGNIPGPIDLDGRPRVVGGRIDIGAYEFQDPGMGEFIGWLQQYGLPTDGSVDYTDSDGDGMNNWQEWIAGTNPTNTSSVLQLDSPLDDGSGVTLTWQSVSGVTYYVQRSTNLLAQPVFSAIQSNLIGQAGLTSYTDATATNGGPYFYRVGVQ